MGNKRNWKKKGDYEFTKGLSNKRWAWEFLRRNQKYIDEWNHLSSALLNRKKISKEDLENRKFVIRWQLLASQKMDQEMKEARKWGLTYGLINPDQDKPFYLSFIKRATLQTDLKVKDKSERKKSPVETEKILSGDKLEIENNMSEIEDSGIFFANTILEKKKFRWPIKFFYFQYDVVAFFDLSLQIEPQINKVQRNLRKLQEGLKRREYFKIKISRKREKEWTAYLRLLDARRDKVKIVDIGNFFFKNVPNEYPDFERNDRVKKRLKRARKWVNYNYKKIAII
jgi:hypothetical protein